MKTIPLFLLCATAFLSAPAVFGHCQVPCGIYDDHARVDALLEGVKTTRIAVAQIGKLSANEDPQSKNQVVRWVVTKEEHAQEIISTMSDYFLTQRVKASQEDYVERLTKHHAVIVAAMKVKQNASMDHVNALQAAVEALLPYYPQVPHTH